MASAIPKFEKQTGKSSLPPAKTGRSSLPPAKTGRSSLPSRKDRKIKSTTRKDRKIKSTTRKDWKIKSTTRKDWKIKYKQRESKDYYTTYLTTEGVHEESCQTLNKLQASLSPKLGKTSALLIGNMVTAVVLNANSSLQIAVAVKNTLSDKTTSQFATILPDYMLVFAVPVLVHYPEYTSHDNADQLEMIRQCLWFILEPLMTKNDSYCFGFYKDLIEKMKNHKDAIKGDDDSVNFKLWAICDIILNLILTKTTNFDMKEFPAETRIPQMYFRKNDDPVFINTKCYLPIAVQMQYQQPKKGITMSLVLDKGTKRLRGRQPKQSSQVMGIDEQDVKWDQRALIVYPGCAPCSLCLPPCLTEGPARSHCLPWLRSLFSLSPSLSNSGTSVLSLFTLAALLVLSWDQRALIVYPNYALCSLCLPPCLTEGPAWSHCLPWLHSLFSPSPSLSSSDSQVCSVLGSQAVSPGVPSVSCGVKLAERCVQWPSEASETKIQIPGIEETEVEESGDEPAIKRQARDLDSKPKVEVV
uniref:Uncharacterized protein n=1 Tax=Timema monikensis TaxID=170555 RepID=A0A7R9EB19_9NEOP|nr:unnamed protein product [Timema monikensis]